MLFRCFSDLHHEFYDPYKDPHPVPHLEGEQDMTLILAGDLGVVKKDYTYFPLLMELANRHYRVIYLPGNHEHYKGSIMHTDFKVLEALRQVNNGDVLYTGIYGEAVRLDGVTVVAHPLYCNMFDMDPMVTWDIHNGMNDFRQIRTGSFEDPYKRKLDPKDYVSLFNHGKDMIFMSIQEAHARGDKVLVATHWGPSRRSIPDRFKGSNINGAYVSDLDELIMQFEPEVWVHGHTHDSFDYNIGNTRVVCNPHGYVGTSDYNTYFDPNLVIEM